MIVLHSANAQFDVIAPATGLDQGQDIPAQVDRIDDQPGPVVGRQIPQQPVPRRPAKARVFSSEPWAKPEIDAGQCRKFSI